MGSQLGADFPHMLHNGVAAALSVYAPHRFVYPLPVKHLPRMEGQQLQNVKLLFGKADFRSLDRNGPGGVIHSQLPEKLDCCSVVLPPVLPPQMGRHPCPQLVQVKGLDDIVVGPRLKARYLVGGFDAGGEEQNGAGDMCPDALADSQAVHAGHVDVQENQIRPGGGPFQGFCPAVCR